MANLSADYVIVGGGLTGCVIASRLSLNDKNLKVLLVEAGPDPSGNPAAAGFLSGLSLLGGELDYVYQSDPESNTCNRVHSLNAGKVLGGGSILNFGGWLRADAADYDDWAETVGDKRWSYEGFKPWFRKSERFHDSGADADTHGFDGPMDVVPISAVDSGERKYLLREPVKQAWTELGVPFNPRKDKGSITGITEFYENSREGMRQPSNTAYPLSNVEVLTNTVVNRVTFAGTTANGVELADGRKITARKEIILCAGTYRTPQLLMLSGVGPSATLNEVGIPVVHDSPHVGQNLHDHFAVYFAFRLRDPSAGYALGSASWQNPALFKGLPWDWVVNEPLPHEVISKHEADAKKQQRNLYEVITVYAPPGIPGIPLDGTHIATSTMLLRPTSRGTVSIRSSSPSDMPYIKPNYFSTALDRDTLVHAAQRTLKAMLATDAMKSIVESETPPSGDGLPDLTPLTADAGDEAIEQRIRQTGTQHHHSGGTASMGKVVDGEGKVMGVTGLRVADASVLPLPLGGHPQATLYPMAEQIASFIIRDA
ncbi:glucose dehydrogenase [Pochonia chlamydosporia 170]|uniref:Glucose dehydrogenase n=1 Tax=Pochonia chlamydosporia 170 TaxID=1380566 RepID=A0A179F263_METCM|nr:glucose dehydrogenase [Pochonia chlamydosporia 170]OAQ59179.1 glucose dehydrogenase [Pochonia chlamydosporia 170]